MRAGMRRLQLGQQRGEIAPHVAARAEEERHHVHPVAAGCGEPVPGVDQARCHEFEESELDRHAGRPLADAPRDIVEGQRPARIARAVGEQKQAVLHRRIICI